VELAGPFWEVVVKQPTTDFGWLPLSLVSRVQRRRRKWNSKILKPAISGNPSAASEDTKAKTAAEHLHSSLDRSPSFHVAQLSFIRPAATIAVRILSLDAACLLSMAMVLLVRSDTDLISGRAMRRATSRSALFDDVGAVLRNR